MSCQIVLMVPVVELARILLRERIFQRKSSFVKKQDLSELMDACYKC